MEELVSYKLDIPFKEFTAGQIIQSKQFNDDMGEIEDKINEIIEKYNLTAKSYKEHISSFENPHKVTATQVGAYNIDEVDKMIADLKEGNLNDNSILNRVLADGCVENRNIKDGSVTLVKVDESFGSQLDISANIDITNRYTKNETDEIIKSKVGDGTYTKEQIDEKLSQVQAGQIVDYTIGVNQLKTDVGELIDISLNPSITNRYTKEEVNTLITQNGLPRDWGSITEDDPYQDDTIIGTLPVADVMTCDMFTSPISKVLDIDIAEVVEARNTYTSLPARLNLIESSLDAIIQMFSEVITNE